jgi:ATP-dependent RNA helicase DeaD
VYVHRTGRTGRAGRQGTAISMVGPREIGSFYYLKLLYKIKPEEREFPSERELKTRREAERYAKVVEEVAEDPGEEYRSLARRVLQSPEGERVLAAVLKRVLEGVPTIVRDRQKEAAAEAELEKRQREEQVRRGERREPVAAADANADRPFERPKRDERGGPGGRREGGFRGREGGRDGGRDARGGRDSRGGDRDRGPRRDDRGDRGPRRDDRPRRDDAPRGEARPERPSLTPAEAPPPGGETREFWEAWVDEKGKQEPAAPVQAQGGEVQSTDGAPAAAPAPRERAPRDRAPRDRAPREAREPRERAKPDEPGTVRLYLNVGKREGLQTDDVTRLVAESNAELAAAMRGVQVRDTHSYLSIKEELVDATIEALRGKKLGERELVVERARR